MGTWLLRDTAQRGGAVATTATATGPQPGPPPRPPVRGHQIPDPRPRIELHRVVRRRLPGHRHQDPGQRRPDTPDERDLRTPCRHLAPRLPGPRADPRRATSARRPDRLPGALQHCPAAPGIAQHAPDDEPDAARTTVINVDSQQIRRKTRPGWPDQRIHPRRLTHGRPAGHLPNPIFERDRFGRSYRGLAVSYLFARLRTDWGTTGRPARDAARYLPSCFLAGAAIAHA
jgi:hypothetical protein